MKLKFALPTAAACLAFGGSSFAVGYTETGDAGDLPATTQIVAGAAGTSLTSITGALILANGISESDLYEIYVNSPSTFSASLTAFVPGYNNFDSQLALFSLTGLGIALDDDDTATGNQSANLPAGNSLITSQQPGLFYLLVTGSGRNPASSGGRIFPNFADGDGNTVDVTGVYGPTGAGGASPLSTYSGSSNAGGNYIVALNGAQFVVVPEPGTYALVLASAAGLGLILCARRRSLAVS